MLNSIDSVIEVPTQKFESYWNMVKIKLKCLKGCRAEENLGYMDEFVWREYFGKNVRVALDGINDIFQQYSVSSFCNFPNQSSPNQFILVKRPKFHLCYIRDASGTLNVID